MTPAPTLCVQCQAAPGILRLAVLHGDLACQACADAIRCEDCDGTGRDLGSLNEAEMCLKCLGYGYVLPPEPEDLTKQRTKVGADYNGMYTYWLDMLDRLVYQRSEHTGEWLGWLCDEVAWEQRFSRYSWITVVRLAK